MMFYSLFIFIACSAPQLKRCRKNRNSFFGNYNSTNSSKYSPKNTEAAKNNHKASITGDTYIFYVENPFKSKGKNHGAWESTQKLHYNIKAWLHDHNKYITLASYHQEVIFQNIIQKVREIPTTETDFEAEDPQATAIGNKSDHAKLIYTSLVVTVIRVCKQRFKV